MLSQPYSCQVSSCTMILLAISITYSLLPSIYRVIPMRALTITQICQLEFMNELLRIHVFMNKVFMLIQTGFPTEKFKTLNIFLALALDWHFCREFQKMKRISNRSLSTWARRCQLIGRRMASTSTSTDADVIVIGMSMVEWCRKEWQCLRRRTCRLRSCGCLCAVRQQNDASHSQMGHDWRNELQSEFRGNWERLEEFYCDEEG